jgi:DNA-directed RNA polymerase subunit F
MANIEVISEKPLTMAELADSLDDVKKRDKDLSPRAQKTYEYLKKFTKVSRKDIEKLKKSLDSLSISRLKDKHIAKIIDINPKEIDSLKIILSTENITLKQEDLSKILDTLKNA